VRDHFDVRVEVLLVSEEARSVARNVQVVMECAALFDKLANIADDVAESRNGLRIRKWVVPRPSSPFRIVLGAGG
jgi:hypothetical protein